MQQLCAAARRSSSIRRSPRCTWPSRRPSSVGGKTGRRPSSRVRPTSCTSAAASSRSGAAADGAARARGRALRRRRCARAGRPRTSGGRRASPGTLAAAPPSSAASTARAARRRDLRDEELEEALQLVCVAPHRRRHRRRDRRSAGSSVRTSSCSLSRKRSTRPSTRTASPSPKRVSSSSTSFQTRAPMRPLGSTSSSARYGAPFFVRSRSFFATAYTPSTVRFSSSCAIAVTGRSFAWRGSGDRGLDGGCIAPEPTLDASTPSRATGCQLRRFNLAGGGRGTVVGILADISPHHPSPLEVRTGRSRVRRVPTAAVISLVPAEQLLVVARGGRALPDRRRDLTLRLRRSRRVWDELSSWGWGFSPRSCSSGAAGRQAWTHGSPVVARTSRRGVPRRRGLVRSRRWPRSARSARSATTRQSPAARRPRRAAVRRHLAGAARGVPAPEPAQRRAADAPGLGGAGGRRSRRAGASRACSSRSRSRRTGGSRRSTSAPTASRGRARASSRRCALEPYENRVDPAARAHARRAEGGPAAAARGDAHAARADLPALGRVDRGRRARRARSRRGGRRDRGSGASMPSSATRSPRSSPTRSS